MRINDVIIDVCLIMKKINSWMLAVFTLPISAEEAKAVVFILTYSNFPSHQIVSIADNGIEIL